MCSIQSSKYVRPSTYGIYFFLVTKTRNEKATKFQKFWEASFQNRILNNTGVMVVSWGTPAETNFISDYYGKFRPQQSSTTTI